MLVIFDLDDTLIHEGFEDPFERLMCAEAEDILKYLKHKGHTLAIASHNLKAKELAKQYNIHFYFDIILGECPPCYTKMPLINKILGLTLMEKKDVVFFDDLVEMASDTKRNGIATKLVDYTKGVTMNDVIFMNL